MKELRKVKKQMILSFSGKKEGTNVLCFHINADISNEFS
jgi:hypothetical protein